MSTKDLQDFLVLINSLQTACHIEYGRNTEKKQGLEG